MKLLGGLGLKLLLILSLTLSYSTTISQNKSEVDQLVKAIVESDIPTIRALIKKSVNLDDSFHPGLNFFIAIELNDMYTLSHLVRSLNPCSIELHDESPVVRAVRQDKINFVGIMGICTHSKTSRSILNYVKSGEMYELLRKLGATPDSETPFHLVDADLPVELRRMLAAKECTQYSKNAAGITLVEYAKSKNAKRILESLDLFYDTANDNTN
jgi:hypothetical protein